MTKYLASFPGSAMDVADQDMAAAVACNATACDPTARLEALKK